MPVKKDVRAPIKIRILKNGQIIVEYSSTKRREKPNQEFYRKWFFATTEGEYQIEVILMAGFQFEYIRCVACKVSHDAKERKKSWEEVLYFYPPENRDGVLTEDVMKFVDKKKLSGGG